MKTKSTLRSFLCLAGTSLLTITYASAADYYWDANGDTAGFGSAAGTTWYSTGGNGNLWSTDPAGTSATADIVTTTADNLYFGTAAISLGGTVTISGTVDANSVSTNNVNFPADSTINFPAEGTYERANNNMNFLAHTFTGLGTSLTWKSRRNMNVALVAHSAGKVILSTSPSTTFPYPGRTAMASSANLGATNAPLEFDGGTLRMSTGFPYATLSALHADHPVSFVADKDAGLEVQHTDTFTVDMAINLGTGTFWAESSNSRTIKLTQANTWGQINLTSAKVEVSDSTHLGPIASPLQFGSGTFATLGHGTLRIADTTMTDLGTRPLQTTPDTPVAFEIVEAGHTFTLDKVLAMGIGRLDKDGAGTLVLTENNTYTGTTTSTAGTLIINGDQTAATGLVDVRTGSVLGGTGTIGGNVTIENTSGLTFNLSTAPGSHDKLDVLGSFTFETGTHPITITSSGGATTGTYTLVTSVGTMTPLPTLTFDLPVGWSADAPEIVGNDLVINITSVEGLSGYAAWKDDNAGGQGPEEDFDNDGVKNGVEFFMNAPAGFTANPALDGMNTITWPNGGNIPAADYGTQFVIQTSPDLATWTDVLLGDLTTNTDGPAGSLTYTLSGAAPRFVRLMVTPN